MKTRDPKKLFPETGIPKVTPKPDDRVIEIRRYKLITPLFGGGVKAGEADPITVIRGASVRGQLRFWWRATRGGQFNGNLDAMRKAENAVWGSAAKKDDKDSGSSKVQVVVTDIRDGQRLTNIKITKKGRSYNVDIASQDSPLSYVTFPLRDSEKKSDNALREKVTFTLEIQYPGPENKDSAIEIGNLRLIVRSEVLAALWAWETFGGIGARTRRGFGALQLVEHSINGEKKPPQQFPSQGTETELRKLLNLHIAKGQWPDNFPVAHLTVNVRMVVMGKQQNPFDAWKDLITDYQNFRQKRFKNKYGMSKWPEANEIRRRWGKNPKWPKDVNSAKMKAIPKFPRAAFGLPVVFHFPKDKGWEKKNFTLQGKSASQSDHRYERMASPLIIKPIPCKGNQAVGLAIILQGVSVPPNGMEIIESQKSKQLSTQTVQWRDIRPSEAKSEPLNQILHGETDVIKAFLKTLK